MAEPNKDYWKSEQVIDYDRKQRLVVPRKDEMLDTIVDFIPFPSDDSIRVLDIGAGQGALSEKVLNAFPKATVTLFDYSNEMLAVAEQRLVRFNDRVATMIGDFNAPDWPVHTNGPFDTIVSALALHYLRTECRAPFFKNVYSALKVPGCFVNAGVFDSQNPFIQQRSRQRMFEHMQKHLNDSGRRDVSTEKLRDKLKAELKKAGINKLLLSEQFDLLEQAGFTHSEGVWRYCLLAVVVAYKE